jgi:hypothetical protein
LQAEKSHAAVNRVNNRSLHLVWRKPGKATADERVGRQWNSENGREDDVCDASDENGLDRA